MSNKIVAIGGGENGRRLKDGVYAPYETEDIDADCLNWINVYFTPGDSLEESDNGNRSSIHWDIVNIQTSEYGGGEIWFDDVWVRKNGIFVLDELKALNPENLI